MSDAGEMGYPPGAELGNAKPRRCVHDEQIRLLHARALTPILANLLCAILVVGLYCAYRPVADLLVWNGAIVAVVGARLALLAWYRREPGRFNAKGWERIFAGGVAATALLWGAAPFVFSNPADPVSSQLITIFVVALATGSVVYGGYSRLATHAFIFPTILPLIYYFAVSDAEAIVRAMAIVMAIYILFILRHVAELDRQNNDGIVTRIEAERLAGSLRRALLATEAAQRTQTEILANVSHEIRTPMSATLGMIDLALETSDPKAHAGYLKVARSAAQGLLGVINNLLDMSRLEFGKVELRPMPFPVGVLLDECLKLFAAQAEQKGLKLELALSVPNHLHVLADCERVRQILINLLSNAIKFTDHGGVKLTCEIKQPAGGAARLYFSVEDSGIGIAAADIKRVFARFQQIDGALARSHQGSGLGLAISRELALAMSGDIAVESRYGVGSRFILHFPCVLAPEQPKLAPVEAANPYRAMIGAKPRRVLVVEDNEVNRMLISHLVEGVGLAVVAVDGAEPALQLLARDEVKFDLVLMDIQMPGIDGVEATRRIRAGKIGFRDVPIVAVTANALARHRDQYIAAGMNGFVAKPIDKQHFYAEIAQALSLTRPGGVANVAAADAGAGVALAELLLDLDRMMETDPAMT